MTIKVVCRNEDKGVLWWNIEMYLIDFITKKPFSSFLFQRSRFDKTSYSIS